MFSIATYPVWVLFKKRSCLLLRSFHYQRCELLNALSAASSLKSSMVSAPKFLDLVDGYSKTCVKQPLSKRPKIGFQDQLALNAGQKYCRMLQGEHSAILLAFIKLPFVSRIFVLSIFEWPFYTGFTVLNNKSADSTYRLLKV